MPNIRGPIKSPFSDAVAPKPPVAGTLTGDEMTGDVGIPMQIGVKMDGVPEELTDYVKSLY